MKKIKLILFMFLAFAIHSCDNFAEDLEGDQTDIIGTTGTGTGTTGTGTTGTGTGTTGTGTSTSIYNGSKPTGNYWSRNDGIGKAYLSLSGATAKACSGGKETIGTFNSSKPSMTFTIGSDVIEFPLLFTNGLLIVGVPNQAVTTNNPTQYVAASNYSCGGGGSTTSGKGTIMVWSDVPAYGFKYNFNGIYVDIDGSTGTVYGGHYTSAPSCGATYCYTKEVAVGTYVVVGKVYPLKPLSGPTPPTYTVSHTVKVEANLCTKLVIR
ncbi:hypothetical protein [Flavobacterium nackdongense]|uniref:Lipoprotein n=1 Tax=Flavobacterium nackdongense TaxID=2547394 RepID=A0A4P6YA00_9FLAO|nr:hypothetical protein [Flavobacterium nackdongense]QBN19911.1 hypothetical protein E1750_14255 [Flavobacterium nackdongense]